MDSRFPYDTLHIALTHEHSRTGAPLLSFEEIRSAAKAAAALGVRRFHITGGEPLEREDIPVLLIMLSSVAVLEDMPLTTNGLLLPRWAKSIRGAGVSRVIVKLDTFDPARYRAMTGGGDLTAVLAGIRAAMEVGFPPATLQVRLLGGVNDSEIPSLVNLTKMTGVSLRLMELTQEETDAIPGASRLTCEEALRLAPQLSADEALPGVYRLSPAAGTVTLVPCSQRDAGCITLSADGMLSAGSACKSIRGLGEEEILSALRAMA